MGKSPLVMHVKVSNTSVVREAMKRTITKSDVKGLPGLSGGHDFVSQCRGPGFDPW